MDVVILGGGQLRDQLREAVERRGHSARLLSRSTGFDLTRDRLVDAVDHADAVIEAPGIVTLSASAAVGFFTRAARQSAEAAKAWDARHVVLSIVNCSAPENQAYGYYAGKAAEEVAAREANPDCRIVRSTQWHVFAEQMLQRLSLGPFVLVPAMLTQPVDPGVVADTLVAYAVGERDDQGVDLAGPEVTTLRSMVRRIKPRRSITIPVAVPGVAAAFRNGALLPKLGTAQIVGPTFDEWAARRG